MVKNLLIALGVLVLIVGVALYFFFPSPFKAKDTKEIRSFEDCMEAGFLVVETQPRECHTKNKQVYVEIYNGVLLKEVIEVVEPLPNSEVTSPFKLDGKAVGGWYYADQITAKLVDENDNVLSTKQVKALESTETDGMVPFTAAITYDATSSGTINAKLIIEKNNTTFENGEKGPLIIPLHLK